MTIGIPMLVFGVLSLLWMADKLSKGEMPSLAREWLIASLYFLIAVALTVFGFAALWESY